MKKNNNKIIIKNYVKFSKDLLTTLTLLQNQAPLGFKSKDQELLETIIKKEINTYTTFAKEEYNIHL